MTRPEDSTRADAEGPNGGPRQALYLQLLRERLPNVQGVSLRLLMHHETFRELCEEYATCIEVLQRLTQSPSDNVMRSEYSALSLRLEGELLRYILEHGGDSQPPAK